MFVRVLRDGNPEFSITDREIKEALTIFCQEYELSIRGIDIILTDSASQTKHNTFLLNHQYDTDVITQERKTPMGLHLELYINGTKVFLEDNERPNSYILRMVFHGLLHVVGYTDGSEREKGIMHLEENRLLELFHVEHKADRYDG